jgi:hypothetical protein
LAETDGGYSMKVWPKNPRIYEINTWVWLEELSTSAGFGVTLGTVPKETWNTISELSMDAVWLMGVWERSPTGIHIAMQNKDLLEEFRRTLPDYQPSDVAGSPYCVRNYEVDAHLGGPLGLASARKELAKRGVRLILDYVPNHVAPDHPWVDEHPEYFIHGNHQDIIHDPASFMNFYGKIFACGKDPYFPAWQDVLQVNAFHPALRQASIEAVTSIAQQCDGMRCDMAMLLMNDVFDRTWDGRAGERPATEFWSEVIFAVKKVHPNTIFIAEAYWNLEWELQQLGFDYCYDKRLYDKLHSENAESVRLHLMADAAYQDRLVRFIENHDEPRAASVFSAGKVRAAAIVIATLPGAKLFHEGQFEGRRVKLPVFMSRRPHEPEDQELKDFYGRLMQAVNRTVIREGQWRLCELSGWPDNMSWMNLAAWFWQKDRDICLIVVNLSEMRSQARVRMSGVNLAGTTLKMVDLMSTDLYERSGNEMAEIGLFVDLEPWAYHILSFEIN